jgi:hypothetical protein
MSNEDIDLDMLPEYLHQSPVVIYRENGLLKVSLDIPEWWFSSHLAVMFATDLTEITINTRIAVRNLEGDVIQING